LTKTKKLIRWTVLRSEFKVLLLFYKSLSGFGPKYISDCLLPCYEPSRPLRSSGRRADSVTVHKRAATEQTSRG
ncbi:hypothetical protein L3Q82_012705, partial [Scortum barcoo]